MEKRQIRRVRKPPFATVDLTSVRAHVSVAGPNPPAGRYHAVTIEDVGEDCRNLRHIAVSGSIRDVVDALRFIGCDFQAASLLQHNGLPVELWGDGVRHGIA